MSVFDWSIVVALMVFVTCAALKARKYTRSVADFLAANRCAGKYLLGMAEGEAALGAVSVIALFEMFTRTGFTKMFWDRVTIPIGLVLALTGFVVYRYRSTRVMTMAQFFEMRYNRNFRIFAGILTWVSGIVNFGIFPAIGARFFIYFLGFENIIWNCGSIEINLTLALFMAVLIGLALLYTFIGGQISVLVTDFWQGLFAVIVFFVLVAFVYFKFPWSQMGEALVSASKPGESLINPLDIGGKKDFTFSFFAIIWFFRIYHRMAWQGTQGYNCSAITPHEAKMAKIVGGLRGMLVIVGLTLLPLAGITIMHHADYADIAMVVKNNLEHNAPGNIAIQTQMLVPVVLKQILPIGLLGGFVAAMLGFFISTNNTYMHSWGSIFIQDVVCMIRKKPLTQKQHIVYLRCSIAFVAIFAFFFSLLFPLKEYIWMFMVITGAIYLGGAGSVIIGGLYWKRGTVAGAWTAMISGCVVAVSTIILRIVWEHVPFLVERWGPKFPYSSQVMAFWAAAIAIVCYVVVSLLSKRPNINMDRLFHRGKYAIKEEEEDLKARGAKGKPISRFWRLIGVNSHEFSTIDKGLFLYAVISSIWWFGSFIVLLALGLTGHMSDHDWLTWWQISLCIMMGIAFIGGAWVSIGGLFDLSKMFKRLAAIRRNALDDGRVVGDHLAADENLQVESKENV